MSSIKIVRKEEISRNHIDSINGYIRRFKTLFIPQQIIDLILFLYAKPIIINLKFNFINKNEINSILYCPINDSWHSVCNKIEHQFNISLVSCLKRGDILINDEESCTMYRFADNQLFEVIPYTKNASMNEVVTVGDKVQLTKDLMGTVRFVGEIEGRRGIYYGTELMQSIGKNNGTVGNVHYFKCKNNRGLFLRYRRIQQLIPNNTIHRIGINDCIELYSGNRESIGVIRYIGIPPRCKEIYYGIEFIKPMGDSDGMYNGTRYFTTNKKYAYFVKASSNHIRPIKILDYSSSPTQQLKND